MKKYSALLIGAGTIGAELKDKHNPNLPQNHAAAYEAHQNFQLAAICDVRQTFNKNFQNKPFFSSLKDALGAYRYDIVSVAVTTKQQFLILNSLLQSGVKCVVAEKPLGQNLLETERIVQKYKEANVPLIVNYTRRYSNTFRDIRHRIQSKKSELLNITIRYAKGIHHNGSHAIDLIRFICGDIIYSKPLISRNDFSADDPTISAHLKTNLCDHIFILGIDDRAFTGFEIDITFRDMRLIIHGDHRIIDEWQVVNEEGTPPGLRLRHVSTKSTDYAFCIQNLIQNAYDVIAGKSEPVCDGTEALLTAKIVHDLKKRLK